VERLRLQRVKERKVKEEKRKILTTFPARKRERKKKLLKITIPLVPREDLEFGLSTFPFLASFFPLRTGWKESNFCF
jgi:hypothetical protein